MTATAKMTKVGFGEMFGFTKHFNFNEYYKDRLPKGGHSYKMELLIERSQLPGGVIDREYADVMKERLINEWGADPKSFEFEVMNNDEFFWLRLRFKVRQ